jgi:hypothetical protein
MHLVIMEWFVVCLAKLSREHVFGDGRGITLTGKGSEEGCGAKGYCAELRSPGP